MYPLNEPFQAFEREVCIDYTPPIHSFITGRLITMCHILSCNMYKTKTHVTYEAYDNDDEVIMFFLPFHL